MYSSPATSGQQRQRDRDDQGDDPYADALAGAVEARHPARDVAAAVVGEHERGQQGDAAAQADGLDVGGVDARQPDRGARRGRADR